MGRRRGRRSLVVLRAFAVAVAVAVAGCGHDEVRPGSPRLTGRSDIAAALLRIELETRLLRQRADEPSLRHYAARLEAIDALLAHVALATRFLGEERFRAAAVGTELAEVTYDLMRVDFEATIRGVGGSVRPACNKGLEWVGIGIQGLERDPGWADRSEEVEQALGKARWHLGNAIEVAPTANILKAGVAEISHASSAGAVIGLTRSALASLARLAAWMERGGAAFGVLQVAPAGGGAAIQLVTSGGALTLTHAEVMVLVNAGQLSGTAAALHMMA